MKNFWGAYKPFKLRFLLSQSLFLEFFDINFKTKSLKLSTNLIKQTFLLKTLVNHTDALKTIRSDSHAAGEQQL